MPSTAAARLVAEPSPTDPVDLGRLRHVLGFRLRRIQNHLSKTFGERLAGRDLKPGEFSALCLIAANPGISQTRLATEGGFDKTSLVVMIDDLERWGWAVRRRSTVDRRRHALYVTPVGDKVLDELFEIAMANEAPVVSALAEQELKALYDTLDRIYTRCFPDETP